MRGKKENAEKPAKWRSGALKCRICNKYSVGVWPEDVVSEDEMQCPHCENMTSEPVPDQEAIDGGDFS